MFPGFILGEGGGCCHSLALPSPRPARGIKREGRHNWLSRPEFCRTRPQQSAWIGKCAPGIQRWLVFRASACAVDDRVGRTERGLAKVRFAANVENHVSEIELCPNV